MSTIADLLSEIEAFCKEAGIAEATFSTRAVNDGKFVGRLREGANVTVGMVERVRAYIATERAARQPPPGPEQGAGKSKARAA